jgi:hypothetical protein
VLQVYAPPGEAAAVVPAARRAREVVMVGTVFDGENYDVAKIYEYATARHVRIGKPSGIG